MNNKCESCNKTGNLSDGIRFDRPVMKWLCDECSDRNKPTNDVEELKRHLEIERSRSKVRADSLLSATDKINTLAAELQTRETECVLKTDRITALEASHGELEMKHHGAESIIRGLEAENAELKEELGEWKSIQETDLYDPEAESKDATVTISAKKLEALKTAQKDLVDALEWYWANWGTNDPEYRAKGYKLSEELLERLRKGE